jgi:hypothetical protein
VGEEPDLAEAAAYIQGERPSLEEEHIWSVLMELGDPPGAGADELARGLLASTHPEVSAKDVKLVLREWRAYVELAREEDWD